MSSRPASIEPEQLLGVLLLALFAVALVRTAWVSDDAYITFRTIDNAVHGFGLRWNVAERVQVYTHPLWLLLLLPFHALTGEIYFAALAVGGLLSIGAVASVAFQHARRPSAGAVAIAVLLGSGAFVDYSTSGLENPAAHLLFSLFAWLLFAAAPEDAPRRALGVWLAVGGLLLTRLDLLLLVAPALVLFVRRSGVRRNVRPALLGLLPLGLWFAFALVYYGFFLPNSAVAKLAHDLPRGEVLAQGLAYFVDSLRSDPLTLVAIAAGVVAGFASRDVRLRGLAAGIVLYLAYTVWIGGDFMSGRFFTAPLFAAVLVLVRYEGRWSAAREGALAFALLIAGLLLPAAPLLSGADHGTGPGPKVDGTGIANERLIYFPDAGLFNGRPGPRPGGENVELGKQARERRFPLFVTGAVGFLGYFAGPDVHVVDYLAVTDPFLARLPANRVDPLFERYMLKMRGARAPRTWRVGHFRRAIPAGYLSFVLGGADRFTDPRLATYVRKLSIVTRGPVFSFERCAEIVRFHFGLNDALIDPSTLRQAADPHWEEVVEARPGFVVGHVELGMGLLRRGEPEAALRELERALELDPKLAPVAARIASIHEQRGDDARALEFCARALEADPRLAAAHLSMARILDRAGKIPQSLAAARRAVESDPDDPDAQIVLGVACGRSGLLDEALRSFERAAELRPGDAEIHFKIGYAHFLRGDRARAADAWRRAAQLGSKAAAARLRELGAAAGGAR